MSKLFADNRIEYVFNLIAPKKTDRILNIGISNIPEIEMLAENIASENISIDIDKVKLEKASKFLKKTKLLNQDFMNAPLRKNYFDKVVILEVFEHLEDDEGALEKIKDLLKKGGEIILSVPNNSMWHLINPVKYLEHKRHYSESSIKNLLERNGFIIEHFNVVESPMMLLELYWHLFSKFILRRNSKFGLFEKNRSYNQINTRGLDLIIKAKKI